jgi:hypothetical protein
MRFSIIFFAIFSLMFSCQKAKESTPAPYLPGDKGSLRFEFDAVVGNKNLQLNSSTYSNKLGEDFTVSMFDYYVSNIKLKNEKGEVFVVEQDSCYFLIKESDRNSQFFTLSKIPAGDYTEMSFIVGVDSMRNTMDVSKRSGSLDVANGMYWSWNSGYIFVKFEGTSPKAPAESNNKFRYHIGGFGGYQTKTINSIREVTIKLGEKPVPVRKDKTPEVHVMVDMLAFFGNNVSIEQNPDIMFKPFATTIADNFKNMFSVHHTHSGDE